MKKEIILKLIELYCYVSAIYDSRLAYSVQRFSNNCSPKFTVQEIMTIYLWATLQKQYTKKDVYKYAINHLTEYFPNIPSYQAFNNRLNNLHEAFKELTYILTSIFKNEFSDVIENIVDSFPIALAKDKRAYKGKVAKEICNKGYCATKDFHYYGCKLHVIANVRPKTTPYPEYALITEASVHDLEAVRELFASFRNRKIYADRAYADAQLQSLAKANGTVILTPYKRKRGEKIVDSADSLASTAISRIRQPIESLFNQIDEKVKLQNASKVRSLNGILTHIWGKLSAFMLVFSNTFYL